MILFLPCLKNIKSRYYDDMWLYFHPVSKISSHDIMMMCDYIFALSQEYKVMMLWWCVIIFSSCLRNIKSWHYDDVWLYFNPVSGISSFVENLAQMLKPLPLSDCRKHYRQTACQDQLGYKMPQSARLANGGEGEMAK